MSRARHDAELRTHPEAGTDGGNGSAAELVRLRRFLLASLAAGGLSAVAYGSGFAVLHDARLALLLGAVSVAIAVILVALRLVRRGSGSLAATIFGCAMLFLAVFLTIFIPFFYPTAMMLPLVTTAVVISYVTGRRLQILLGLSLCAMAAVATIGVLSPAATGLPSWAPKALVVVTVPLAAALVVMLLGQFAGRLRATNEHLEQRVATRASELVRSEAMVRALIASAPDAVVTFDADGRIIEFNDAAERMLGRRKADVLGHDLAEMIVPPPRDGHETDAGAGSLLARYRGSPGQPVEMIARRAGGDDFSVEAAVAQVDLAGSPPMFTVFLRDITERKRAEEALRANEQRFFAFAENMPLGVYVVDHQGRSVFMNGIARTILGKPLEPDVAIDALPELYRVFVRETDEPYPAGRLPIARALQGERNVRVDDMEIRRPERSVPIEIVANPIVDESGGVVYAIAAFSDVTDRRLAEETMRRTAEQLVAARELAERANLAKSEFLSRMSHELRTPLNAILGFAELLSLSGLEGEEEDWVGHISQAGEHLLHLINDVLDVSRVESGKLVLSLEPVELSEVVEDVLQLTGRLQESMELTMVAEVPHDTWVTADRNRLKQVVLNLVSNAAKYNRRGGAVTVGAAREGDRVVVRVRDTGEGIPPEMIGDLFMPFARLGAERSKVEGTGLGLALSRSLVEEMGGELRVESTGPDGTVFTFDLARAGNTAGPSTARSADTGDLDVSAFDDRQATIVYVEDNPANFQLVAGALARFSGYTLLGATEGREGLALIRRSRPAVVLLDLNLPDMSGQEVLAELQKSELTRTIPVVVLTADAMTARADELLAAGATAYLTKPFRLRPFLELMAEITAGSPNPIRPA